MSRFKRILVPVDFSSHSAEAIRVAADLAARFDAQLTLAHVYDPMVYALPDGYILFEQPQLEQLLAALEVELSGAKQLALEGGARRVDKQLLQGSIGAEIVDFAGRGEFDLIVMGTHGRTGAKHLLLGSIAERVARLAPCPVLSVKGPGPAAPSRADI